MTDVQSSHVVNLQVISFCDDISWSCWSISGCVPPPPSPFQEKLAVLVCCVGLEWMNECAQMGETHYNYCLVWRYSLVLSVHLGVSHLPPTKKAGFASKCNVGLPCTEHGLKVLNIDALVQEAVDAYKGGEILEMPELVLVSILSSTL